MRHALIGWTAASLLALASPPRAVAEAREATHKLNGSTAEQVLELSATDGWEVVELRLEARVRRGRMEFRLVDPEGRTRMTGTCDDGRMTLDSGELQALPGSWRLELEFARAHGEYRIAWDGR